MPQQIKKVPAEVPQEKHLIKELDPVKETKVTISLPAVILTLAIIAAGVFTGFILATTRKTGGTTATVVNGGKNDTGVPTSVGRDCKMTGEVPEGILKTGGIDGEGTHHLERDGGPARNVYLTSSVVILDNYVDKKVRLCGETLGAQQAGWLMDVLKLDVIQ